ncbi:MAG: glycosyltransferase family 2 protein [Xanthomonadales bacterium]|nr:glycosyltransferase family 2 protein [Xanthomonadales bacterium]
MINGKSVAVVMPAFRAGQTLEVTWRTIPHDIVDYALLVDDASDDNTVRVARELGIDVEVHERNRGYGANQKTCYARILERNPDIVVMLHPDYQYEPRLLAAIAAMISSGIYDIVIGSRILGGGALAGGMPWWKYLANRVLTLGQNLLLGAKLSEYHTGYRAYSSAFLRSIPWTANSDDFIFDNQLLAQAIAAGYAVGEISTPTKYFEEASSINFRRSLRYGLGVVWVSVLGFLNRTGLYRHRLFALRRDRED